MQHNDTPDSKNGLGFAMGMPAAELLDPNQQIIRFARVLSPKL
jgi:hypothetical protein